MFANRPNILKNKNLLLLWLGHVISHSGDAIYQIALPWLVLELTGSKTTTSLVALSAYLPTVLFSLFAGVVVDRYNRRSVMILSDIVRMALVFALVGYLLSGGNSPLVLGAIAFMVATFATLFYPARDALIPDLVDATDLVATNAFMSTSGQFAHMAGPALAGFLAAWVGLTHLFTIDALSFAASLVALAFLVVPRHHRQTGQADRATHLAELMGGLRFVWQKRPLGLLIMLTALNNLFIMGPALIGTPIFVREVLGLGFGPFAVIEAHMAAGMLVGSFLVWRLAGGVNPSLILFAGMIMDGLTYSVLYFVDSYEFTRLALFIHGIGIPMITISRTTIVQKVTPANLRGRVFSMVSMSVLGLTALSAALLGPIAEWVPITTIFMIIGLGAALCGVAGLSHRGMMRLVTAPESP